MCTVRGEGRGGSVSHQHDEEAGAWGGQEVCALGLGPHNLPPYNDSVSLGEGSRAGDPRPLLGLLSQLLREAGEGWSAPHPTAHRAGVPAGRGGEVWAAPQGAASCREF